MTTNTAMINPSTDPNATMSDWRDYLVAHRFTAKQLRRCAKLHDIPVRSTMRKAELIEAIARWMSGGDTIAATVASAVEA